MVSCAACGYSKTRKRRDERITFHVFPKRPDRRDAWIRFMGRADYKPTPYSRLCSQHFTDSCFDRASTARVQLNNDAIPTIGISRLKYARMMQDEITERYLSPTTDSEDSDVPIADKIPLSNSEVSLKQIEVYNGQKPGSSRITLVKLDPRTAAELKKNLKSVLKAPLSTPAPSVSLEKSNTVINHAADSGGEVTLLKQKINEMENVDKLKTRKIQNLQNIIGKQRRKIDSLNKLFSDLKELYNSTRTKSGVTKNGHGV
ncbi:THAP domain-containing protein 2-like [Neodiprion virginianus]|uniref:THAP domain-containing protein 2-like n=1 Tax=Neodiprion virginianus TaxID=2961670 RepID=UPI001EE6FC4D|nr:THAP domain-containing protein 2-like [Neodiprion virginianus]